MRPDYVFKANRIRNWGVRIYGYVMRPSVDAKIWLEEVPGRVRDSMRFRLCFKPEGVRGAPPCGQVYFEHYVPVVLEHVRTLIVALPDGTEHRIEASVLAKR